MWSIAQGPGIVSEGKSSSLLELTLLSHSIATCGGASSHASVRRSSPVDAVSCHPYTTAPRPSSASVVVTLSNAVGLASFSM